MENIFHSESSDSCIILTTINLHFVQIGNKTKFAGRCNAVIIGVFFRYILQNFNTAISYKFDQPNIVNLEQSGPGC